MTACTQTQGRQVLVYALLLFRLSDRLCSLAVRAPGYRFRGPEFDSRRYQIFCQVARLERSPLSLVRVTEELLERKNSGFGLVNRD
jgi:hypothetical protein